MYDAESMIENVIKLMLQNRAIKIGLQRWRERKCDQGSVVKVSGKEIFPRECNG